MGTKPHVPDRTVSVLAYRWHLCIVDVRRTNVDLLRVGFTVLSDAGWLFTGSTDDKHRGLSRSATAGNYERLEADLFPHLQA